MVQQLNRSSLEALRLGQATDELNRIRSTPYDTEVALDFETTGLNPRKHQFVMVQLKPKGKKPLIIDARGEDRGALHSALLPLVTDSRRVFTGQNLLFELSWMLSHLGFEVNDLRATFSDTMLRELVILGLGYGDAKKRGLAVNMHDIAERYGLSVRKEERSWFIDLDQRPEEWAAPFPQAQLEYGRQDVSVVHLISAKQQELIDEYGLQGVVDLEARVLPATAGMQHYGLSVYKEKWLGIMAGIDEEAEKLAALLHVDVDVPILEHRRQAWLEKAQPYQQWVQERDAVVARAKESWELNALEVVVASTLPLVPGVEEKKPKPKIRKDYTGPSWKETKQATIELFEQQKPRPKPVAALKDGANLNSSAQILVAMRSRGHQIDSVDKKILAPLAAGDPVVQLYLDYQDYATAMKKYGPKFLETHAANGVIHADIQQLGTETGRYSFREPNIQQVPARGAGAPLRTAIVPREGYIFIDFDFTAVELMIAADITRDPIMLQAFADGEDLHARTAELMFDLKNNPEYVAALASGVTPKKWTESHDAVVAGKTLNGTDYRAIAKTINFGLLYGMGQYTLASKLRIPVDAARVLMRLYRDTYKVAGAWHKRQGKRIELPDQNGRVYATTLAGRRRWFTLPKLVISKEATADEAQEALDKHNKHIAGIQRQLGNHPIQGTGSDITKYAIALWQERWNCNTMRLVHAVHDELLIECINTPEAIALARQRLGGVMEEALRKYLKVVSIREVTGITADHWQH